MIYLIDNRSSLVTTEQTLRMIDALRSQACEFAEAWDKGEPIITTAADYNDGDMTRTIVLLDGATDAQDELGDHSVDEHGNPTARILCAVAIANGTGDPLRDVCPVLSHEFVETEGNPYANRWAEDGKGGMIALEMADPDQGTTYEEEGCLLSNFMRPEFFDPYFRGPGTATNFRGTPLAPCSVAPSGYAIVIDRTGVAHAVFGERLDLKAKEKILRGRGGRLIAKRHGKEHVRQLVRALWGTSASP